MPVLHPKFAPFYGFNNDNAIIVENLADGMRRSILMSSSEYLEKQTALTDFATRLETESLNNLKEILK